MSGSQSPYTNAQGTVFPFMGSGDPLATQAYATAADTAVKNAIFERLVVIATADGTGTGTITPTDNTVRELYVATTSANAAHKVILPQYGDTNYPRRVTIHVGPTGFELASASTGTVGINGGLGASSTIAASSVLTCTRTSTTGASAWVCTRQALSDGALTAVEASHG